MALFNYVFARKEGGQFILRIEDTDRARSTKESEEAILRALKWVGLRWDEGPDVGGPYGPYRQSERSAIYAQHARDPGGQRLGLSLLLRRRAHGGAARAAARREEEPGLRPPLPLARSKEEAAGRVQAGEKHVVRLAMPTDGKTQFNDGLRGDLEFENTQIDDQVLLKSDGFPTYHLANVVDDHLMKITHVIRAEEWISSTPKHVQLYRAFGWEAPKFIHMPLLRNVDKSKISKRKNPVSLDYYRDAGYLPEALLNFLGLMGFSFGGDREKFTLPEMVAEFDWAKVSAGGPVFDLAKLSWLNGLYIRDLSPEQLLGRLRQWRLSDEFLLRVLPLAVQRMERLDQFLPNMSFFFTGDLEYTAADLIPKGRDAKSTASALAELADVLDTVRPFTPATLEPAVRGFAEKITWKPKELFMTVRVAMTGRTAAPGLFETMEVVGKELVRRRLRQAAQLLKSQPASQPPPASPPPAA